MSIDPKYGIEELEADLHESQFKKWDVETFLADRHRSKVEALTAPGERWAVRRQVAKEVASAVFLFVGQITIVTLFGHWFLTGNVLP